MLKIKSLPEIQFVDSDAAKVEAEIIGKYEELAGRTLAKGDPIRTFLEAIAYDFVMLKNQINETGKQNLLRYAVGDNLDHLGILVGANRVPATAAKVTMRIELSEALNFSTTIPTGTRFTAGDKVFFGLDKTVVIPAGELAIEARATCLENGTVGNDYLPGQIKTLVDPIPYVSKVVNINKSEGGSETESDEDYRNDIHLASEAFSVAGPFGAYEYHARRADNRIIDVNVYSPIPGVVEVRPLIDGGVVPEAELLEIVLDKLNDRAVRPLTDKVEVYAPEPINYSINIKYYINSGYASETTIIEEYVNEAVQEYVNWQCGKLGRDINPSELVRRIMETGAKRVEVISPVFTELTKNQFALATDVTINLGGFEDE